jgi:pyrroline-5-carboxylate reductase
MAEAILAAAIAGGLLNSEQVIVSDPDATRRQRLNEKLAVPCVEDNAAAAGAPCVLLAVKPQVLGDVLNGVASSLSADALIISIAAGISTGFIDDVLGGKGRIVRVMPNTPILVGQGMSTLFAGPRATSKDLQIVTELLTCGGGKAVVVEDESAMDAVTAVAGSGPAYLFYLLEAMIEAARQEGLSAQQAHTLAIQTALGAATLASESDSEPAELRRRVTSPGGTTQAAIESLDSAGVKEALVTAIRAAARRSRQLGNGTHR